MNDHSISDLATCDDFQLNAWNTDKDDLKWVMRFYMEVLGGLNKGSHGVKRKF